MQLSFQEWTQQIRDMLEARKRGDIAFRDKDFEGAIDGYTTVSYISRDHENTEHLDDSDFCVALCSKIDPIVHGIMCMQFIDVGNVLSPTVYARRSICHLLCDQPDFALRDAMQAQLIHPEWHVAFYLQAVALVKLGMPKDAADMLNEACTLEKKRHRGRAY